MPQPKGRSGNPKGKPKGTKSEKTKQWEALGEAIVTRHANRFNEILDTCEDEKFADKFLQVLEYFQPKLARTELKHEGELDLNLGGLSDEDLLKLAELQNKIGDK